MTNVSRAQARAHANIALAKYWGKSDTKRNLPAVPSISLTLDQLATDTEVLFDPALKTDEVRLDGRRANPQETARVVALVNRVRKEARIRTRVRVSSHNRFPTAAGLASSASGFAALSGAAAAAAGLRWSDKKLSALARSASASAARSVFGGFAELPDGEPGDDAVAARQLAPEDHWNVRLVVALTERGPKKVGSTEGMERSRRTSPFYDAWLDEAPRLARKIKRGIRQRDLSAVGEAMEQSTFGFHLSAMTSSPSIVYWAPATIAALRAVHELREAGIGAWATMDAGPHVKVLCESGTARRVSDALKKTPGVDRTQVCKPGPGLEVQRGPR